MVSTASQHKLTDPLSVYVCYADSMAVREKFGLSVLEYGSNTTARERYPCGEHQGVRANIHFNQIRKLLPRETTTKQSGSLRACPGVESAPRFSLPLQTCRPQLPPCKHRNRKAVTSTSSCQVRLKPAETRLRNSEYYRVLFAVRKSGRQASNGEQFPCGQRGQALEAMA